MRKKIKYQGGITKVLCQKQAERNKKSFGKALPSIDIASITSKRKIDFEIISFSGAASFEDQVLSVFSFLFYAGIPEKWVIYSDKSYTEAQKQIFKDKFPFVTIVDWDVYDIVKNSQPLSNYLKECQLAKKLNVILGHRYTRQTIYMDSDILCYHNLNIYLSSSLLSDGLWYAPDPMWGTIADNFEIKKESIYQLNSGFLILNDKFNKGDILAYFESLNGNFHYFSEQSSFEYAFRNQNANMLDPRQFVIDSTDQFDFSMKYYPEEIAMRHYTTPVRHKIFQKGWKWHLKIQ